MVREARANLSLDLLMRSYADSSAVVFKRSGDD